MLGRLWRSARPPAPRSPRELLLALRAYDKSKGLDEFLSRFDFTGVTPHQVYYSVLGRLPESAQFAQERPGYEPLAHYRAEILGTEFQSKLVPYVVNAFPEKKRLFFVHVPKCAGSDLAAHLRHQYGNAYFSLFDQTPAQLLPLSRLSQLQALVTGLAAKDTVAVSGHLRLDLMFNERLTRFGDVIFSVVRDPLEISISMVNFVLTHLLSEHSRQNPGIVEWLEMLGLGSVDTQLTTEQTRQMALRLLRDPKIVLPNHLCHFLGRGDVASTIDLCAATHIELTTVSRYEVWLKQRWDVAQSLHANESRKYLHLTDLSEDDRAYLYDITREDRLLYEKIDRVLTRTGRASLFGAELADA